jgi:hypothetical protein
VGFGDIALSNFKNIWWSQDALVFRVIAHGK